MSSWVLTVVGFAAAFAGGWMVRGLRDQDRATQAAIAKVEQEYWARKKFVKLPKEGPST